VIRVLLAFVWLLAVGCRQAPLKIGLFDVDASPPIGSPMAYDPTAEVLTPLSCRGVVLVGSGEPIVLCAVDWIGIGNETHDEFRAALARAAGTTPERVAVHALHQHDAPWADASIEALLETQGAGRRTFDTPFARSVIRKAAEAVGRAAREARPVTHLGLGRATVEKVASNRRILGPDGKVRAVRWTATTDPAVRAEPEGTIDPELKMISFWEGERAVAALTYYATHPQSYYRTGKANPDFPGIARNARQAATGVPHVHFTGAGGNIGAGKYNDGKPENRQILADRMADAMARAWTATRRKPIAAADLGWRSTAAALPPAPHLDEKALANALADERSTYPQKLVAANKLAWLRRCRAGEKTDIGCLILGDARVLHMPGELFVEYQLAAQQMRPDLFVAMAAYGDYAPAYIGTEAAYPEGGYETGPDSSFVAPSVEKVLMGAISELIGGPRP
jgi:hypothetical protein